MTATIYYSKFIWADWLLDHAVRRCSPAARALWLDMLALSVRSEPVGVMADGGTALTVSDFARAAGMRNAQARRLLAELENNGVFSRDERERIYSRRIVREHRMRLSNKANAARGGNPWLSAKNASGPDIPPKTPVKSQESQVTSQQSEPDRAAPVASLPMAPILRAAQAMGTTLEALHRKLSWSIFDYTFQLWVEEGCDPERDIWPTIGALTAKRRGVPESPAYFAEAVREARDRRLEGKAAPRVLNAPAPWVSPEDQASRLKTFGETGIWPRSWGPKPDTENGTQGSESASP
ncbi:MAG: hypothetical protein ACKVRO_08300 [Micropepsaceae bacterium]